MSAKEGKENKDKSTVRASAVKGSFQTDSRLRTLVLILIFVSAGIYSNTLFNDYCLDDTLVITENTITQKGFSGIGDHITNDLLYGYTHVKGHKAANAGWRPLSLITYSIEIGIFGKDHPGISHFINVLLYAAIVVLLFFLLYRYWIKDLWVSFFAALLFALHPLHTEVVANIKSRDDLLCLLFILLSLHQLWKYIIEKKSKNYLISLLCFFLAFTSKESAITFIAGIPFLIHFLTNQKTKSILSTTAGYLGIALFYLLLRNAFVPFTNVAANKEIINNAFLNLHGLDAFATKMYVMIMYIKLLIFPFPLSYDYSYHQIPDQSIGNPFVLLALIVYVGLLLIAIMGFKKKNIFSMCALLFLTTISIGSNLFIEIGTLMAERIVFIPSIFFCLALALGGKKLTEFIKARSSVSPKGIAIALFIPFALPYAGLTFARNFDWKNNQSLPLADIAYNPNSARVNAAAGSAYLMLATRENVEKAEKDSLVEKAFVHLKKSISIYPEYNDALLDLGFYYNLKGDFDSADVYWSQVRQRSPNQPKLKLYDEFLTTKYMNPGMNFTATNPDSAIYYLNKALPYAFRDNSKLLTIYFNLAGMYFGKKDYQNAHDALQKVLAIDPNYPNAKAGFDQTEQLLKAN